MAGKLKRWIVERTFAWLNHSRRLSKNYELTVASAETLIKIFLPYLGVCEHLFLVLIPA